MAFNRVREDRAQDQIGNAPTDGGGNLEFPEPLGNGRRVAKTGLLTDPLFGELKLENNTMTLPLTELSPARGIATSTTSVVDGRGFIRDGAPDAGSYEFGALCSR